MTYRSVRLYIYFIFFQYVCSLGIEPTTFCAANAMLYHWATGTVSRSICAGIVFGRNAVLETGQILRWVNYSVMTLIDLNKPFYIWYIHWLSPRGRSSSESLLTSIIFKTVEYVFCVFVSILTHSLRSFNIILFFCAIMGCIGLAILYHNFVNLKGITRIILPLFKIKIKLF